MAKALTAKSVENVKPLAQTQEIPDGGCRGLYLIVHPTGKKSWAVRYRFEHRTRKLTFDAGLTLAEARAAATTALHELARGNDPAAQKFEAQAKAEKAEADRNRDTVEHLAHLFIEQYAKRNTRPNSWRQAIHVFDDIVLPAWRGRVIHDIQRRDIRDLVEGVAEKHPVMANRALGHLSKFFNWLLERDVIEASPCAGIRMPAKEHARERLLDDSEIRRLWLATETLDSTACACVRLLLLTGQRRNEIASLKWSEVKGDTLELPVARMKAKRPHLVPLSTQAAAIIASLPQTGDYVFGRSPVWHMDRIKQALDAQMGDTPPWVIHDLRRTAASGMAALRIPVPTIEKILDHRSGTFRGIVGVYQLYDFATEKRDALQRWSDHVIGLVSGQTENKVIRLKG
jgi:integrase